jgi:hypothetical protein
VRRPSPALLIALLALFVALGGPAQARRLINGKDIRKGTIRSTQIRDRSLSTHDLSNAAIRSLRQTPAGSITDTKLADGAVTTAKLAGAAVTGAKLAANAVTPVAIADGSVITTKLADGSITGAKIADASLTTLDVARFAGRFRVLPEDIGTIHPQQCWHGEPRGLAPELAGADISQDAVFVAPRGGFNELATSFSWRTSPQGPPDPASLTRFVIALCNETNADYAPPATGIAFSYVVFDIP